MKTLFHLIDLSKEIALGSEQKILPAEEFSQIVGLEELIHRFEEEKKKAQKERAREKREQKKQEREYRKQVVQECELLKEEGEREGFARGFESGMEKWMGAICALEEKNQKMGKEWEAVVGKLALKAAKRIVGEAIETNSALICDVIGHHTKQLAQCSRVVIYVHPSHITDLEENRERVRSLFERLESLSFQPKEDVEPGGCLIETEVGILDARLEKLWETIEKLFSYSLMKEEIQRERKERDESEIEDEQ